MVNQTPLSSSISSAKSSLSKGAKCADRSGCLYGMLSLVQVILIVDDIYQGLQRLANTGTGRNKRFVR